ncbi:hypothetical protein [Luteimonas sp. 3794]|uniref:hypothetical protein n=1 Tax=Luteimonas sp. 3794 TaxID=2817730 RepID=UPI002860D6B4|nr:hypothetical protein [Luteimonas sp. 3794]MDR6990620.1 hypothetical protein [Luteimonas sp. 3794]
MPISPTAALLVAFLMIVACATATAAEPPSDWYKRLQENRPLAAMHGVRQMPEMDQVAAQLGVFVGDETGGCTLFGGLALPEDAEYRDALDTITEAASGRRVVMLNESHFRTVHRAFLLRVIERLHALGFDALAAETLNSGAPSQLRNGPVDVDTGFYTPDPVFAAALRRAQGLGWDFVHYEAMHGNGRAAREAGQARNLADWLTRNPGRRLLVYAGGSHISKVADDGWMAARFIADTGIDPLTIQQSATACPETAGEWPVQSASALVAFRAGVPMRGSGHADLMVLHPPAAVDDAKSVLGAPTPICIAPTKTETLLRAFSPGDPALAIARDQVRVPKGARAALLWLTPGRYRIEREHLDGRQTLGYTVVPGGAAQSCLSPVGG